MRPAGRNLHRAAFPPQLRGDSGAPQRRPYIGSPGCEPDGGGGGGGGGQVTGAARCDVAQAAHSAVSVRVAWSGGPVRPHAGSDAALGWIRGWRRPSLRGGVKDQRTSPAVTGVTVSTYSWRWWRLPDLT